ncbi:MAG: hypothetical protein MRY74_04785 [Neomegalonema sp.]|nr:hypothetical protein [Neomegalonema sp.]
MRIVAALVIALLASASPASSEARRLQLVMVELAHCPICKKWEREVGGVYAKTAEGKRAPLRRIDITAPPPDEFDFKSWPKLSPTFVLFRGREEIGRIEGYSDDFFFWARLGQILAKAEP